MERQPLHQVTSEHLWKALNLESLVLPSKSIFHTHTQKSSTGGVPFQGKCQKIVESAVQGSPHPNTLHPAQLLTIHVQSPSCSPSLLHWQPSPKLDYSAANPEPIFQI